MEALTQEPFILQVINKVAENEGMRNYSIRTVEINKKGEGFISKILLITVQDNIKKLEIVTKSSFANEKLRRALPIYKYFQNEVYFYTEILPILEEFTNIGNLQEKFVPRCFKAEIHEGKEILCFENLKMAGFELFDTYKEMDDDHISLIFEKYGRFHALGFVLKIQRPEQFAIFSENFQDVHKERLSNPESDYCKTMKDRFQTIYNYFQEDNNGLVVQELEKYCNGGIIELFREIITQQNQFATILHGDCWSNNILFKYEDTKTGRKPTDLRLLDFQVARINNPVLDLSYCLYSSASKEVLTNLEIYLRKYYDNFSAVLKRFGYDHERVYSFSALKENWKEYSKFGLIQTSAVMKVKVADKNTIRDLVEVIEANNESVQLIKVNEEEYKKRMMNIVHHMFEINAL